MFQYRQALVRMRQGDSDRDIARSKLMGRPKAAALRAVAQARGWLDPEHPLPDDAALAAVLDQQPRASTCVSTLEPLRSVTTAWFAERVQAATMYAALLERHGYTGSYSSVRRFVRALAGAQPPVCTTTGQISRADQDRQHSRRQHSRQVAVCGLRADQDRQHSRRQHSRQVAVCGLCLPRSTVCACPGPRPCLCPRPSRSTLGPR